MLAYTVGVGRRFATLNCVVVADRAQDDPAWAERAQKLPEGRAEIVVGEQMRQRIVERQYHVKRSRDTRPDLAHVSHGDIDQESPGRRLSLEAGDCRGREVAGNQPKAPSCERQGLSSDAARRIKNPRAEGLGRRQFRLDQAHERVALLRHARVPIFEYQMVVGSQVVVELPAVVAHERLALRQEGASVSTGVVPPVKVTCGLRTRSRQRRKDSRAYFRLNMM